jgi:hypothetical protein
LLIQNDSLKVTLRIKNSKISDRVPKGFISLSEEPVNTVNDLSNEVEDKSVNNMGKKKHECECECTYF